MSHPEISRRCLECGASVRADARFCPQCGKPMKQDSSSPSAQDNGAAQKNAATAHNATPTTKPPPASDASVRFEEKTERATDAPARGVEPPSPSSNASLRANENAAAARTTTTAAVVPEAGGATTTGAKPLATVAQRESPAASKRRPAEMVKENLRPRVEKLRDASLTVLEEASDDTGLRFVLIAVALFLLFLLFLLLNNIIK